MRRRDRFVVRSIVRSRVSQGLGAATPDLAPQAPFGVEDSKLAQQGALRPRVAKHRQMVLQRAWSELQAWRRRYADLKEFADLIDVIDETVKKLPKAVRKG